MDFASAQHGQIRMSSLAWGLKSSLAVWDIDLSANCDGGRMAQGLGREEMRVASESGKTRCRANWPRFEWPRARWRGGSMVGVFTTTAPGPGPSTTPRVFGVSVQRPVDIEWHRGARC